MYESQYPLYEKHILFNNFATIFAPRMLNPLWSVLRMPGITRIWLGICEKWHNYMVMVALEINDTGFVAKRGHFGGR